MTVDTNTSLVFNSRALAVTLAHCSQAISSAILHARIRGFATTARHNLLSNLGETDLGDKGKKDKGKREQQKKAQLSPQEKRKLKKDKKK